MYSNNKLIRDVASVAAQIMSGQPVTEKLHPNQQKLDVHEPEKDELTSDDFKKLRAGKKPDVKKEEVEQIDELSKGTLNSYVKKSFSDKEKDNLNTAQRQKGLRKATSRLYKEDEEQLDEVKMADLPSTKVQGRAYGASKPEPHPLDVMKGPTEKQLLGVKSEKKKKFSEMVDTYKNNGLKPFLETLEKEEEIIDEVSKDIADYTMDVIDAGEYTEVTIGEEASEEEFNAEIKKAQAKSEGKDKAEVAKGAVQAIKSEEVEHIEEREMTDAEMKKRETIVKSMKKGMAGFKERYGDRAKNVMYATATRIAKDKS